MTIPFCVDLPLMMILSIVCQADDGTIIDMRTDTNTPSQPMGLFSTPSLQTSSSSHTNIKTTFSSSDSDSNNNNDKNDDNNNDFLPYCDLEHSGTSCFDRQDDSSKPGFFECRNGDYERHYQDCKDAGNHPDEQLNDNNDNNNDNHGGNLERLEDELDELTGDDNNDDDDEPSKELERLDDELKELTN